MGKRNNKYFNKKSIFIFILAFLILSCKSKENKIYEFDPRVIPHNEISLSEIADDITYIPLEDSLPIGMYYQYELANNLLYLSIKDIGILTFNQNGKVRNKIGNIGRGPGEYKFFMNFTVDEQNENIYVLDYDMIKIYSRNGNFLRTISLRETGGHFQEIEYYNSKLFIPEYIGIGKAKYNWIIIDTLGNMIDQKKNFIPEFPSSFLFKGGTFKHEDKISYWNIYDDTVYSILPDLRYKVSFLFSKGDHRHPRFRVSDNSTLINTFHPHSIFETDQFLIISYYYKQSTIVLIDKNSRKTCITYLDKETGGIANDIDWGVPFKPTGYFIENEREYMTDLIDPFQLKAIVQSKEFKNSIPKYPDKKENLEKLARGLIETDNPILMLVRLKK
jgi:hypothetical protein